MRAEARPQRRDGMLAGGDVVLEPVEIDDQHGRWQLVDAHAARLQRRRAQTDTGHSPPMVIRRLLIALVLGGLLTATAVAGYAVHGYQQATPSDPGLILRVDRKLHAGAPQTARQALREALAGGDITGAELRTRGGRITVMGETGGLGTAVALPHGGSLRLGLPVPPAPLAGVSRLESFIAGLLIALAAGALVALVVLRLLPHVLRPDLLAQAFRAVRGGDRHESPGSIRSTWPATTRSPRFPTASFCGRRRSGGSCG